MVGRWLAGAVRPRRLAHRRRQHDRPLPRPRPQRGGAAHDPPDHARGQPRHDPARRVDERRLERLPGRRVARRHDLHELHAADLGLAFGAGQRVLVLRAPVRDHSALRRRTVLRRAPPVRGRIPLAHAARDDERARHARHPAVPDEREARGGAGGVRDVGDASGHPRRVRRGRVRPHRGRRRSVAHAVAVGGGARGRRRFDRVVLIAHRAATRRIPR